LDKIRKKRNRREKVPIHVELYHPNTTVEEDVMITGHLVSNNRALNLSPKWNLKINRVDEGGNVEWSSGRIHLAENGSFAKSMLLKEGKDCFKIMLTNPQGRLVETDKDIFSIERMTMKPIPKLQRGIGIVNEFDEIVWFFEKGTVLPAEKTIVFKTMKELKSGDKKEAEMNNRYTLIVLSVY